MSLFQCGQCGKMGLRLSITAFDTVFPEVTSGITVGGSICSSYLVAVLGKDRNYCSWYPDFPQGVKCGNGLASIGWCKLLGVLVSIGLGMLGLILKVLLNLQIAGSVLQILVVCILQLYSI